MEPGSLVLYFCGWVLKLIWSEEKRRIFNYVYSEFLQFLIVSYRAALKMWRNPMTNIMQVCMYYSELSLIQPVKVSWLEGWPNFRGEFVLQRIHWDISNWHEYRSGLISGVQIGGSSLLAEYQSAGLVFFRSWWWWWYLGWSSEAYISRDQTRPGECRTGKGTMPQAKTTLYLRHLNQVPFLFKGTLATNIPAKHVP